MIKRIIAILAAVAVIGLIVSSGPSNAASPHATTAAGRQLELQAHPPWVLVSSGQCQNSQYCAWTNAGYGGDFYAWQSPYWDFQCITVGAPMKNAISAVWNKGQLAMTIWSQTNCGGWWNNRFYPNEHDDNLSGSGMNDETESIKTAYN